MSETPETDARIGVISNGSNIVDAGWARQLERERDEARGSFHKALASYEAAHGLILFSQRMLPVVMAERDQLRKDNAALLQPLIDGGVTGACAPCQECDQLRKVADELALAIHTGNEHGYGLRIGDKAIESYNQLPHVVERDKAQ